MSGELEYVIHAHIAHVPDVEMVDQATIHHYRTLRDHTIKLFRLLTFHWIKKMKTNGRNYLLPLHLPRVIDKLITIP
jgi:hypothetical protein